MLLSCLYIDYLYSLAISGRIVFLKGEQLFYEE